MLKSIHNFKLKVENKQSGVITDIVRIKNSFKCISQWKKLEDYSYSDIKINVLIQCHNVAVIGEIIFLPRFMMKAKDLGHSLYKFARNQDFMNDLSKKIYNKDKKQVQIEELKRIVLKHDFGRFTNVLLYSDVNKLVDLKMDDDDGDGNSGDSLLAHLFLYRWNKAMNAYFACVVRQGQLNGNDDIVKQFVNDKSFWKRAKASGNMTHSITAIVNKIYQSSFCKQKL